MWRQTVSRRCGDSVATGQKSRPNGLTPIAVNENRLNRPLSRLPIPCVRETGFTPVFRSVLGRLPVYVQSMGQKRQDIEAFVRHIVVETEAAKAKGIRTSQDFAEHFNAKGLTTRTGRSWSGTTMERFLASSGPRRYRRNA